MNVIRPRARSTEQTMTAILDAAAQLTAEGGCEAATLRQMSRRSGVLERTILYHFGSKEGVLREICHRHMARLLAAVEGADQPFEWRRRRLDGMALAFVGAIAESREAHATMLRASDRLSPDERRDLRRQFSWLAALFLEAMEALVPALKDRADLAKPAALSLLVTLNQHDTWFREGGGMPRSCYARFAVTSILAGVRLQLGRALQR